MASGESVKLTGQDYVITHITLAKCSTDRPRTHHNGILDMKTLMLVQWLEYSTQDQTKMADKQPCCPSGWTNQLRTSHTHTKAEHSGSVGGAKAASSSLTAGGVTLLCPRARHFIHCY